MVHMINMTENNRVISFDDSLFLGTKLVCVMSVGVKSKPCIRGA